MSTPVTSESLEIQTNELKKAALVFRAINHQLRLKMVQLIHEQKRIKVTDIFVKLRIEQSEASFQLSILRKANLVCTEREGKMIYYSVNYDQLRQLSAVSAQLLSD
jgi:DNA-binding transcriptional ArsR family regulator